MVPPMMILGRGKAPPDEFDVLLRGRYAHLRLLLERMQHVDRSRETHRIDRSVGVAVKVIDNLKYTATSKPPERFRARVLISPLRSKDGFTHYRANVPRKVAKGITGRRDPLHGLHPFGSVHGYIANLL